MQRKILALAVASALAIPGAAIAQVTISGTFRFSVDNTSISSGTVAGSGLSKWHGSSHSSNVRFQSREDLGGGMTAWAILENGVGDARTSAQSALWNGRNSGIGLESKSWGTVMVGNWDAPYKSLDGVWNIGTAPGLSWGPAGGILGNGDTTGGMPNPNCQSADGVLPTLPLAPTNATAVACATVPGTGTAFQRRLSNTLQWWSPVWNGVQLLVGTQMNEEKANTAATAIATVKADPSMWSAGLRWTGPKWAVIVGYETHKNFNLGAGTVAHGVAAGAGRRSSTDTGWKLGGNYNFGPVIVSLVYEALDYDLGTVALPTSGKQKNWAIAGALPVGKGTIRASYADSKNSGTAAGFGAGTNADLWNLSYDYALSKRTLVYASYAKLDNGIATARNYGGQFVGTSGVGGHQVGQDSRTISFGMNHSF